MGEIADQQASADDDASGVAVPLEYHRRRGLSWQGPF